MTAGPFPDLEADLVQAAAAGDQAAFRTLWAGAQRQAYALCVRLTGSHADAADALQETQIAAWRGLGRFTGTCSFAVWVYAIARNAALGVLRTRKRRGEVDLDGVAEPSTGPFTDAIGDTLDVRAALAALPANHREAVLLWASGLTYAQVATVMSAPTNSIRVWIHRARHSLRDRLGS
ncbi:RNA polymerase sigma factor [Actinokineospora cianjurensis]|uniref:RNA polymerase sigma-70 factor (ECF subfamily) n=1 Tax=Actinokineospora cianjurensis TaxID=585224 RepID=A0A421AUY8_9PSEU|nr:RNA polymerase sigma factor [Actinokineospora cianjurensis]RLK53723.1 RNA polymerase sigma-70 factor (ECF subfamily) [Actinokineospora cianjurensis]